ncbi:hypothetical protein RIF29_13912 [Crotalaria pallida]|uniref:Uncharacterized protein n=1 Tax=Crotalaria pallida TaxID=3830 RepID=A0AAN9IB36_CROPI
MPIFALLLSGVKAVIMMILAANAAVGVITETNAEKALEELRAYQADVATVVHATKGEVPVSSEATSSQ